MLEMGGCGLAKAKFSSEDLVAFAVDTAITPGVVSTLFWSFPPTFVHLPGQIRH